MTKPARDLKLIRQRARQVLATYAGGTLTPILADLRKMGDVGVFGGLMRDTALDPPALFASDVDLVIAVHDEAQLDHYCESRSAVRNRFGGYRLALPRGGRIDVWPLQRTWAFREGVRRGSSLADLVGTTYFSWDSIVYDLNSGRIHCRRDYVDKIESSIVDIELPDNPYPLGALVRTLRLIASSRANVTYKLACHTLELFGAHSANDVAFAERRGYARPWLTESTIIDCRHQLEKFVGTAWEGALFRTVEQLPLPFAKP